MRLYKSGALGIIFNLPEVPGGDFLNIFCNEMLVDKAVQGPHYRFGCDGTRIGRIYDLTDECDIQRDKLLLSRQGCGLTLRPSRSGIIAACGQQKWPKGQTRPMFF